MHLPLSTLHPLLQATYLHLITTIFPFSLNCQIALQKYIDYYPAFEMSGECKFLKVDNSVLISLI